MPPSTTIQFGVYEVDLATGELHKDGVRLRIQDQPLKVLRVLLDRPGELVTREQLKQAIAPDSTFGDFDHALNVAVAKLRTALNDPAERPVYIETLHKRGYRFIAPLIAPTKAAGFQVCETAEPDSTPAQSAAGRPGLHRNLLFAALAAVALLAATATLTWLLVRRSHIYHAAAFTSLQGEVVQPLFSPDGNDIFFSWRSSDSAPYRIYVQSVGSVVARPLIEDADPSHNENAPHLFPDGRSVAYVRRAINAPDEIWVVPRTGGVPRKLLGADRLVGFDIAPEGNRIVLAEYSRGHRAALYLVALSDGTRQQITNPEDKPWAMGAANSGDRFPRFSPDGQQIAFTRLEGVGAELYVMPASGGTPERLTDDSAMSHNYQLGWATWTPDSKSLLVSCWHPAGSGTRSFWRISLSNRRWEALAITGSGTFPALSSDGRRLAFVQSTLIENLWKYELKASDTTEPVPVNVTHSTSRNAAPMYSPDGTRLVFASNRTGHFEIYTSNSDGSNLVQRTFFAGNDAGSPCWSPDGRQIAFDYRPANHVHIFVMDATGGPAHQITSGDNDNAMPHYSHDGKWIYFARLRSQGYALWKVPAVGGEPNLVSAEGWDVKESPDGTRVYYGTPDGAYVRGIGGKDQLLVSNARGVSPTSSGFYFRAPAPDGPGWLGFYNASKGQTQKLLRLPSNFSHGVFAISPDGKYVIVSRMEVQSNIMLVEDFK